MGYKHYKQGDESERLVCEEFNSLGFNCGVIDCYYDLEVDIDSHNIKIEVKCTNLVIKNGGGNKMYGRFEFTDIKNRRKQRTNSVYICFVVCIKGQYEILGFLHSRTLNAKKYVHLPYLMNNHHLKSIEKFIEHIKRLDSKQISKSI